MDSDMPSTPNVILPGSTYHMVLPFYTAVWYGVHNSFRVTTLYCTLYCTPDTAPGVHYLEDNNLAPSVIFLANNRLP